MRKFVRVVIKKATFGRKWHMNWLRVLLIGSVILTVGGGCATTKRVSINHSPAHTEAPIINPNKQQIKLYLPPLEDKHPLENDKDSRYLFTSICANPDNIILQTPPSQLAKKFLTKELESLGIEVVDVPSGKTPQLKGVLERFEINFSNGAAEIKISLGLYQTGKPNALWKGHIEAIQHPASTIPSCPFDGVRILPSSFSRVVEKALSKAVSQLSYDKNSGFAKAITKLAVSSPKYLADQEVLAKVKAELIPINSKYRVATDSAVIRKMPRADSEVIKEIGMGSIIQIIGKLPSGWMQVAREGESIGWIHGDSVAIDSTFTPPNQQQAQTEKKPPPQSGTGSGFFVSKMGHVITNAHVVKNCNRVTIGDNANKQVPAEVVNADKSNDLALLKLSTLEMASAESKSLIHKLGIVVVPLASKGLLRSEDVRLGEKILVAGYPFGDAFSNSIKVTTGVVSSIRGVGDDSGQFQLDAAVQPGNSGGPIYDSSGNIVGVVISQLNKRTFGSLVENVNFGVKASTVRQFLVSSGLSSKKSERTEEKSTEQLAEIAQNQALMVMCLQ